MTELTDKQIEFIQLDVLRWGIHNTLLHEDIVDHICCLVEEELTYTPEFQAAYLKVIRNFGPLRQIASETSIAVRASSIHGIFYRYLDHCFTLIYVSLGFFTLAFPFVLLYLSRELWLFLLLSPMLIFGYIVCFTRINYRTFEMIPFK